jgi:hypothetical protein
MEMRGHAPGISLLWLPAVIVTCAAQKLDEKTLELKDQATKHMIKLQLEGFGKFINQVSGT